MPDPHPRLWYCKNCNAALGSIRETSNRVDRLDVFRQAVPDLSQVVMGEDVFAVEAMDSGTVRCSHCGNRQTWHVSERAMERLLLRRQGRLFGQQVGQP